VNIDFNLLEAAESVSYKKMARIAEKSPHAAKEMFNTLVNKRRGEQYMELESRLDPANCPLKKLVLSFKENLSSLSASLSVDGFTLQPAPAAALRSAREPAANNSAGQDRADADKVWDLGIFVIYTRGQKVYLSFNGKYQKLTIKSGPALLLSATRGSVKNYELTENIILTVDDVSWEITTENFS